MTDQQKQTSEVRAADKSRADVLTTHPREVEEIREVLRGEGFVPVLPELQTASPAKQHEAAPAAPLEGAGNVANKATNGGSKCDMPASTAAVRDGSENTNNVTGATALGEAVIGSRTPRTEVVGAVPEGWKLVPVEMTPSMRGAYVDNVHARTGADSAWNAMLAAAPTPPADAAAAPDDEGAADARFIADYVLSKLNKKGCPNQWSDYVYESIVTAAHIRQCEKARAAASQPAAAAGQEAVAWVRKHPDGELSGDWLWNDVIEQCRKDSGVWFPLGFLTAPSAQAANRASDHIAEDRKMVATLALTDAERDVLAERRRQIEQEGWTPINDDQHDEGEMAIAAACYAESAAGFHHPRTIPETWPWAQSWWKPTTPRRDLIKAGALILAEIERLDRALLNGANHAD